MKISYERLFNLGNYNNERIALEDDVLDGESPLDAYNRLRALAYEMAGVPDPRAPKPQSAPVQPKDDADIAF